MKHPLISRRILARSTAALAIFVVLLTVAFLCFAASGNAQDISASQAPGDARIASDFAALSRTVAENHLFKDSNRLGVSRALGSPESLTSNRPVGEGKPLKSGDGATVLAYVYPLEPAGYIVVPASTDLPPVMAYSYTSNFNWSESGDNVLIHLLRRDITLRLQAVNQGVMDQKVLEDNRNRWNWYRTGSFPAAAQGNVSVPLLFTFETWHQDTPYNNLCPTDPVTKERSVVGCVAIAMTHIMNYWQFPTTVVTSAKDSYTSETEKNKTIRKIPIDGTTAGFADISYNDRKPTDEVKAKLCYTAGVLNEMSYSSDGSGSVTQNVENVFRYRFGFSSANFVEGFPKEKVVENLVNKKPIVMSVRRAGGGHAINCDGYDEGNQTFHLVMGWGGMEDGYYAIPAGMPNNYTIVGGVIVDVSKELVGLKTDKSYDRSFIDSFRLAGGKEKIGLPSDQAHGYCLQPWQTNWGVIQELDGGTYGKSYIVKPAGTEEAFAMTKVIVDRYVAESGPAGALGLPLCNVYKQEDGLYRVNFQNGFITANATVVQQVSIGVPGPAPDAPQDFDGTAVAGDEVELVWTEVGGGSTLRAGDTGYGGYQIYRKEEGEDDDEFFLLDEVDEGVSSYKDTDTAPETTYHYYIEAYDEFGESQHSREVVITTPSNDPVVPANFAAMGISSSEIRLAWQNVGDNVGGIYIERRVPGGEFAELASLEEPVTAYTDTGIDPSTTYEYRISAFNDDGYSDFSEELKATTMQAGAASGGGGGCFIATAAFGSYQESHVMVLRQFRDSFLLTNGPGTAFVNLYYRYSPPLAAYIAANPAAKAAVRMLLLPVYGYAYLMNTGNGWVILLMAGIAIVGTTRIVRKRKAGKAEEAENVR